MRVAIVSDVHGNLTAFEAVLADMQRRAPDLVLHGGDLALMGAEPAEVDRPRARVGLAGGRGQHRRGPLATAGATTTGRACPQAGGPVEVDLPGVRTGNPGVARRGADGVAAGASRPSSISSWWGWCMPAQGGDWPPFADTAADELSASVRAARRGRLRSTVTSIVRTPGRSRRSDGAPPAAASACLGTAIRAPPISRRRRPP